MPTADRVLEQNLKDVGLSEKEVVVYLALLEMGSTPASVLARKTRIVKSTVQYTCQQLEKKGLVTMKQKGRVYQYTPESPKKLLALLARRQRELKQMEEKAQDVIETLNAMMGTSNPLPEVRLYEGEQGMIELYESILDMDAPIDSFEDKGEMLEFMPDYPFEFIVKRIRKGIFNRVICPAENLLNSSAPQDLREIRTLQCADFPFTGDVKICEDMVGIFSFDEKNAVGIAIRHGDISKNFRILFESYWKLLGERSSAASAE